MNVSCPDCRAVFRVDPAKITSVTLRARCASCGGVIAVGESVRWADDLTSPYDSRTPTRRDAAGPPPLGMGLRTEHPTPSAGVSISSSTPANPARPAVRPLTPPFSTPASPAPAVARAMSVGERAPITAPSEADDTVPASAPATARPSDAIPAIPRLASPAFGAPFAPPHARTPVETAAATSSPFDAPAAFSADTFSPPPPGEPGAVPARRRPINPFLANDPNQKARRLARALVSDMVAYHPQKREEGLRDGTLKQLFREEIKKSYEEYVEQVGTGVRGNHDAFPGRAERRAGGRARRCSRAPARRARGGRAPRCDRYTC